MEERIIELETRFSFQEDVLHQLNEAVIHQQGQIEKLRLDIERLGVLYKELQDRQASQAPLSPEHEKPPHY